MSLDPKIKARLTGDPGEARTHDPVIKSHLLYQLSYRVIVQNHESV